MDESIESAICLGNLWCLAGLVATASSAVAVARRLQSIDKWPRRQIRFLAVFRQCVAGAAIASIASSSAFLFGGSICPVNKLPAVAALTVLAGIACDWSSKPLQQLLKRLLIEGAIAYLKANGLPLGRNPLLNSSDAEESESSGAQ